MIDSVDPEVKALKDAFTVLEKQNIVLSCRVR